MKKVALFVEGLTELCLIQKFIKEVYEGSKIAISTVKIKGGSSIPITFTVINAASLNEDTHYLINIYSCGGDSNIASYIRKHRESLMKEGFCKIIGIRDVHPIDRSEIPKLRSGLYYGMPQKGISVDFVLSVMEIETWFLSEYSHFEKIHPDLNVDLINTNLGFHPINENMEIRDIPSNDIHSCYQLVGESYNKTPATANVQRTIDSLDYTAIYFNLRNRVNSISELIDHLDKVFDV